MNPYQDLLYQKRAYFYKNLKNSSYQERIRKIKKIKQWLLEHQQDIRNAVYNDFHKTQIDVDISEIKAVLLEIRYAVKKLKKWTQLKRVKTPLVLFGSRSCIRYEPKGVVLIISPWNFPFLLTIVPLISAIAAGNSVLIKPSEISTQSTALLEKMISEIFDALEVNVVSGDANIAAQLTALPFDHIYFTGSPEVGKKVMQAAAANLTSVTLELGGQNPVIIDETANIKETAERLIFGKLLNYGQACVSPNYIFVNKFIAGKLAQTMLQELEKRYPGDKKNNPDLARIINHKHFVHVKELLNDALSKGAKAESIIDFDDKERFIAPAILSNTPQNARLFDEEIFGPVIAMTNYENLNQVIDFIRNKPTPLALYVFSQSKRNIKYILDNTTSGTVAINETSLQFGHPGLPFGGHNQSGVGKSHGYNGFIAFSNERPVLKQKNGFTVLSLIRPPYTEKVKKLMNLTVKYL